MGRLAMGDHIPGINDFSGIALQEEVLAGQGELTGEERNQPVRAAGVLKTFVATAQIRVRTI
jgi:hypothetical protein